MSIHAYQGLLKLNEVAKDFLVAYKDRTAEIRHGNLIAEAALTLNQRAAIPAEAQRLGRIR